MTLKKFWLFLGILFLTVQCSNDPLDVDASEQTMKIQFLNIDSILVNAQKLERIDLHHRWLKQIPEVYSYQLGYCLGIDNPSDTTYLNSIDQFLRDPYIQRLEHAMHGVFRDLSKEKMEIIEGFKYLKYHFPEQKFPSSIVFLNSLFRSSAFCTEHEIGIGLERYLGEDKKVIKELPGQEFPQWMKNAYRREFMSRDAVCAWIMTHFIEDLEGNLAEKMIRWGKILYLTKAAFPEATDAHIMRYTEQQHAWSIENEYALWKYLVDQKMLFKIDELNETNLLNEGPFSPGLPEKGPDRLGQFLGYRMILKYMEIKPCSLKELIEKPYTEILVEYEID